MMTMIEMAHNLRDIGIKTLMYLCIIVSRFWLFLPVHDLCTLFSFSLSFFCLSHCLLCHCLFSSLRLPVFFVPLSVFCVSLCLLFCLSFVCQCLSFSFWILCILSVSVLYVSLCVTALSSGSCCLFCLAAFIFSTVLLGASHCLSALSNLLLLSPYSHTYMHTHWLSLILLLSVHPSHLHLSIFVND